MTKLENLYYKLQSVFQKYTVNKWSNEWRDSGYFLLTYSNGLRVEIDIRYPLPRYPPGFGTNNLEIEIKQENKTTHRIDINIDDKKHSFYLITDEFWDAHTDYIINLCQETYNKEIEIIELLNSIPIIYHETNPNFFKQYQREKTLENLIST